MGPTCAADIGATFAFALLVDAIYSWTERVAGMGTASAWPWLAAVVAFLAIRLFVALLHWAFQVLVEATVRAGDGRPVPKPSSSRAR